MIPKGVEFDVESWYPGLKGYFVSSLNSFFTKPELIFYFIDDLLYMFVPI